MSQTIQGPTTTAIRGVFWARVVLSPPPNATWQRDQEQASPIVGMQTLHANVYEEFDIVAKRWHLKRLPFILTVTGTPWIEYSTSENEPFTGSISGTGTDATMSSTTEIDTTIAVAAGAAATLLVAANPVRTRGVTVQNMGTTLLYVSKRGDVTQAGANASIALPPGAAANDGTGGTVVFDGWRGGVWAINAAGGPGSALISAY